MSIHENFVPTISEGLFLVGDDVPYGNLSRVEVARLLVYYTNHSKSIS